MIGSNLILYPTDDGNAQFALRQIDGQTATCKLFLQVREYVRTVMTRLTRCNRKEI